MCQFSLFVYVHNRNIIFNTSTCKSLFSSALNSWFSFKQCRIVLKIWKLARKLHLSYSYNVSLFPIPKLREYYYSLIHFDFKISKCRVFHLKFRACWGSERLRSGTLLVTSCINNVYFSLRSWNSFTYWNHCVIK